MDYTIKLESAVNSAPYNYKAMAGAVGKILLMYGILYFTQQMSNYLGFSGAASP